MVVYLDLVFILNSLSDALALYVTARLSGLYLRTKQFLASAVLGGMYGALCLLPQFKIFDGFVSQMILAFLLVHLTFGKQESIFRIFVLFLILSCTLGGAITAVSQYMYTNGVKNSLQTLDWKVFFLVGIICYFFLSVVFRSSAKHAVSGQICRVSVLLRGQRVSFDALLDTGHTLCDPITGSPVLTVWCKALESLWLEEERKILVQLEKQGSLWCAEQIYALLPGKFRLLPYCAVGVHHAMLLTFRADDVTVNGERLGSIAVALSATPVSDGGGYSALWGGERKEKTQDVA